MIKVFNRAVSKGKVTRVGIVHNTSNGEYRLRELDGSLYTSEDRLETVARARQIHGDGISISIQRVAGV